MSNPEIGSVINFLNENPYLYKSFQAIKYAKENPLHNDGYIVNDKTLCLFLFDYITMIITKFFNEESPDIVKITTADDEK